MKSPQLTFTSLSSFWLRQICLLLHAKAYLPAARRDNQASFPSSDVTEMEGGGVGGQGDRVNSLDDRQASVNNPLILEETPNQCLLCFQRRTAAHRRRVSAPRRRGPLITNAGQHALLAAWMLASWTTPVLR